MKPSELAARLRRIASKIEASSKPSRALVSRDLRRVLANMEDGAKMHIVNKGPWGWAGYVVSNPGADLAGLVAAAEKAAIIDAGHRGSLSVVPGPTDETPAEGDYDGGWSEVDGQWMAQALQAFAAGDDEALIAP